VSFVESALDLSSSSPHFRKIIGSDGVQRSEDKVLSVNIKPGWKSGTKITFPKEGDQAPGRLPADIAFIVRDKPHPKFKREGSDIRYTVKIPLRDALCGVNMKIPTIDGPEIPYKSSGVIKPHSTHRWDTIA
jgi:DnaJ-class molecular chaperone